MSRPAEPAPVRATARRRYGMMNLRAELVLLLLLCAPCLNETQSSGPRVALLCPNPTGPEARAVQLAVQHMNSRDATFVDQASALPAGFRLDLLLIDCTGQQQLGGGSKEASSVAAALGTAAGDRSIVGMIPNSPPETASQVAMFSTAMQLPLVAPTWTADALGDQGGAFPFLHRTVPSDRAAAEALIRIIKQFGRMRVAVVYEERLESRSIAEALEEAGHRNGIYARLAGFELGDTEGIAEALSSSFAANIRQVVCVATAAGEAAIVSSASEAGLPGQEQQEKQQQQVPEWVFLDGRGVALLGQGATDEPLTAAIRQQKIFRFRSDVSRGDGSRGLFSGDEALDTVQEDAAAAFAYDAAWALGFAVAAAEEGGESSGTPAQAQAANAAMRNVSFGGASGLVRFTSSGDRDPTTVAWALDVAVAGEAEEGGSAAAWEPIVTLEAGAAAATGSLPALEGPLPALTARLPTPGADGLRCPKGTVLNAEGFCPYHVAIILPFEEGLGPAMWSLAALEALNNVNARESRLIGAEIPSRLSESLMIEPLLIGYDGTAAGAMAAGLEAVNASVIAVIGAGSSDATYAIMPLMEATGTPVLSFSARSDPLSSYSLFTRFVMSDHDVASAAAQLILLTFEWRRFGIIYETSVHSGAFFHAFRAACLGMEDVLEDLEGAAKYELFSGALSPTTTCDPETSDVFLRLKEKGVRVFLLSIPDHCLAPILRAAMELDMLGPGYVYIFLETDVARVLDVPDEYGMTSDEVERLRPHLNGMLNLALNPYSTAALEMQNDAYVRGLIYAFVRGFSFSIPEELDRQLPSGAEATGLSREIASNQALSSFAYDTAWALALGLSAAEEEVEGWLSDSCGGQSNCHGASLSASIRKEHFVGLTRDVQFPPQNATVNSTGISSSISSSRALGDRISAKMALRLQRYDAANGNWTRVGSILGTSDSGLSDIELYEPAGMIALLNDGSKCPPGWFFDAERLDCMLCEPGTYNPISGASTCMACDAGHFCNRPGCASCTACSSRSWQNSTSASTCILCPVHSEATTDGATSVTDCVCMPGYYRRDGLPGKECYTCPTGGICPGGSYSPLAEQGVYGDWSIVDVDVEDSPEAALELDKTLFRQCSILDHCTNDLQCTVEGIDFQNSTLQDALDAPDIGCRSNVTSLCRAEYAGIMCQQCKLGFFKLGGLCFPCRYPAWLFTLGCVMVVIFVWYLINRVAAGRYEAVDLLLLYLQNASTISFYSLNWSQSLQTGLFTWLSIVNFDVTFVTPDCLSTSSYSAWSYGHSFGLQLALPIIILGCTALVLLCNYATIRLLGHLPEKRSKMRVVSVDGTGISLSQPNSRWKKWRGKLSKFLDVMVKFAGWATTKKAFAKHIDRSISDGMTVLNLLYHTLTAKCLEVFMCFKVADGSYRLTAAPEVPCWEGAHHRFVAMGVVGLVVYTVCIPLAFLLILEYGRVYNLFRNQQYMARFGWLYLRYERSFYFWELAILFRRGMLVVVLVILQSLSGVQIALGFIIVVASITMHFYAQPFVSNALDALEMFSLISLAGLLCSGVLFFDQTALENIPGWETLASVLTWLSVGGCLILVIIMVIHDIRKEESTKRVSRHMKAAIHVVLDLYSPTGKDPLWGGGGDSSKLSKGSRNSVTGTVMQSFRNLASSFGMGSNHGIQVAGQPATNEPANVSTESLSGRRGSGGTPKKGTRQLPNSERIKLYDKWSKLVDTLDAEELELHRTIDIGYVEGWFDNLMRGVDLAQGDSDADPAELEKQLSEELSAFASFQKTFSKGSLTQFARKKLDKNMPIPAQLGTVRFYMANHWMKNIMADTSPVSFYSTRPYSIFFGNLVAENPYLIDHILHASEEDLQKAKGVINDLRAAQMRYTRHGRLAGLVSDIDKGPLLAWLMVASHSHKEIVRELMVSMYKAKNNGEDPTQMEADKEETGYKGFMDSLIYRFFPGGSLSTGLNRHGKLALTKAGSSRRGFRSSPEPSPGDSQQGSSFSAFEVPRDYRRSMTDGSSNPVGSFFGKIIGLAEFSMSASRLPSMLNSGRLRTVREENESQLSMRSGLFGLMTGVSRRESSRASREYRRSSRNEGSSNGMLSRSRESWAAVQSRRESPYMDRHSIDLPSLPRLPTAKSAESSIAIGRENADDSSHKIDMPGELNNAASAELLLQPLQPLSGGSKTASSSRRSAPRRSQGSETDVLHPRSKRPPKISNTSDTGEHSNDGKGIPSAGGVDSNRSRECEVIAQVTGRQLSDSGQHGRTRRSSRVSSLSYNLPATYNAEAAPKSSEAGHGHNKSRFSQNSSTESLPAFKAEEGGPSSLLQQPSLENVGNFGEQDEKRSHLPSGGEIPVRAVPSEAEVQPPSAAAREGDRQQEAGGAHRRTENRVSSSGIEIDDSSGAAEAHAATADPEAEGRDNSVKKAVKDAGEASPKPESAALRSAVEVQSPSAAKGEGTGEADRAERHKAASSAGVETAGGSPRGHQQSAAVHGDLRPDNWECNRRRRGRSTSDSSAGSSSDDHTLFPTAGRKRKAIARERRTIQAEVLKYSVDEEVSRKFNIQRFDEEIQRLSNFASPVEAWLHDLEQRIAQQSGTQTSLSGLINRSQTKHSLLEKGSASQKPAAPAPKNNVQDQMVSSWEAIGHPSTDASDDSLPQPTLPSNSSGRSSRHRSKFNLRSRNASGENLADRPAGGPVVQSGGDESDD